MASQVRASTRVLLLSIVLLLSLERLWLVPEVSTKEATRLESLLDEFLLRHNVQHNDAVPITSNTTITAETKAVSSPSSTTTPYQESKTKIVGFADFSYVQAALQWYDRLTQLGYQTHLLVVTDRQFVDFLANTTYRYELAPIRTRSNNDNATPWQKATAVFAKRWSYSLQQLKRGYSLVLTDVDNIFNQYVSLEHFYHFDVWHAYGTKWPRDIYERQGFVVCGGMVWLKATPATIRFVQVVVQRCKRQCDDQKVVNKLLAGDYLNVTWNTIHDNATTHSDNWLYDGIPLYTRTGVSPTTGHSIAIWNRQFALRCGPIGSEDCPADNWVSMPDSNVTGPDKYQAKLKQPSEWDAFCAQQGHPTMQRSTGFVQPLLR